MPCHCLFFESQKVKQQADDRPPLITVLVWLQQVLKLVLNVLINSRELLVQEQVSVQEHKCFPGVLRQVVGLRCEKVPGYVKSLVQEENCQL